jgi:hypothetical protein
MGQQKANYRRVKIHRCYTVEEAAQLLEIHKNTVRAWIKDGLQTCDQKRPTLIRGCDLALFLKNRKASRKRPCRLGELYCLRCRAPKIPVPGLNECQLITEKIGNLSAICPDCTSLMYQRVSRSKLELLQEKMEITFPIALRRLGDSNEPIVNSDFQSEVRR